MTQAAPDSAQQVDALLRMTERFWDGEAEVIRTFFSAPRPEKDHAHWLRAQCYKEINGSGIGSEEGLTLGPLRKLLNLYPVIDDEVDRHEYMRVMENMLQEFKHFCLLADILDSITGTKTRPRDLKQLPEDAKLEQLRRSFMSDEGELGEFVVEFTEGGKASIFREGSKLSGGALEDRIASAFRVVAEEEAAHMEHGADGLRKITADAEQWGRATKMIEEICRQRLRMRNEQFGFILSEERVRQIGQE